MGGGDPHPYNVVLRLITRFKGKAKVLPCILLLTARRFWVAKGAQCFKSFIPPAIIQDI